MARTTSPTDTPDARSAPGARLTSRQRRIEEQRAKIERLRSAQRRKRLVWGAGILVALVAVAALVLTQIRPAAPAQGRQVPSEGAGHVQDGTPLSYRNRPPSSGQHFGQTASYGFSATEISPGNLLHNLEHGAVAVLSNCPRACPDLQDQLRQFYQNGPKSRKYGNVKMVITPYRAMDKKVAVVAWGWVDEMDEFDPERVRAFYQERVDRGPEDAP